MIFPKPLARVRFWVGITAVLVLATLYFLTQYREFLDEDGDIPKSLPIFKWLPMQNVTFLDKCRNSQQGDSLIVDELGYVCPLSGVLKSGCCEVGVKSGSRRFECSSCRGSGCCEVYEHCVSCCMHPNKLPLLHRILSHNTESFHPLYSSLKDQFELCLSKCRTSSQSVQHENAYRNPLTKFCYGTDTPTLLSEA